MGIFRFALHGLYGMGWVLSNRYPEMNSLSVQLLIFSKDLHSSRFSYGDFCMIG